MGKARKILFIIKSIPNTIRFNFHYFSLKKALHFPVLVSYKVRLQQLGDKGSLECPKKFASIRLGFSDGSFSMGTGKRSTFVHDKESKINFMGSAVLCNPFYITVKHKAEIIIGNNFQSNTNFILNSAKKIVIGNNALVAWNVTIIDGDGHLITNMNGEKILNYPKEIIIGDETWIAAGGTILKGSKLAENTIVSANAVVSGEFDAPNTVVGGVPAKVMKNNILWKVDWIE